MNYLAHAFLSNNDHDLLVGNFIADHIRGNIFDVYSEGIIEGIYLHRRIDSFTDAHPQFKKSKRIFYEGFEKFSGILVDIYFDHLLAKNFSSYSKVPLKEFAHHVYHVYSEHEKFLPKTSHGFLSYVVKNNIYFEYSKLEGIQRVLSHLSHRIGHKVQLDESVDLFQKNEKQLEENFNLFFKEAIDNFHF